MLVDLSARGYSVALVRSRAGWRTGWPPQPFQWQHGSLLTPPPRSQVSAFEGGRVERWLPGRALIDADMRHPAVSDKIAAALAQLHGVQVALPVEAPELVPVNP